jgi:putative transposase
MPVPEVCRNAGISSATFFNWKKKSGGPLPTVTLPPGVPSI